MKYSKKPCKNCSELLVRSILNRKQYTCAYINSDWKNVHRYSSVDAFDFECPKILDLFRQVDCVNVL